MGVDTGLILGYEFLSKDLGLEVSTLLKKVDLLKLLDDISPIGTDSSYSSNHSSDSKELSNASVSSQDEIYSARHISAYTFAPVSYGHALFDPIELDKAIGAGFGKDSPDEIRSALKQMLGRARANGLSDASCSPSTKTPCR